jgi:diguanylate cyclase (GGDEF)-like protein
MDDDEEKARGFDAGGIDYILKPFNLGTVKSIVQTHMNLLQYRDQLENISRFDPLTGLPNFIYFEQVLGSGWFSAADAESYLAIVLIDIDYFKEYNENYGPVAGDECLRAVSRVVKDSIESREDFVARYGGEKFSVMLFHCDKTGAGSFAERIRRKVEALNIVHEYSKISGCVTVSAGGAVMIPRKDESVSTLLRLAEDALDRVKEEGRNRTKIIAI